MMGDITWHASGVDRDDRRGSVCGPGATVWMTGLSGSGKSTVAMAVERELVASGIAAYTLDADNTRSLDPRPACLSTATASRWTNRLPAAIPISRFRTASRR